MNLEDQGPLRQSNAGLGHRTAEENRPVRLGWGARNAAQHPHPAALPSYFPSHIHFGYLGYCNSISPSYTEACTCSQKMGNSTMLELWTSQ